MPRRFSSKKLLASLWEKARTSPMTLNEHIAVLRSVVSFVDVPDSASLFFNALTYPRWAYAVVRRFRIG